MVRGALLTCEILMAKISTPSCIKGHSQELRLPLHVKHHLPNSTCGEYVAWKRKCKWLFKRAELAEVSKDNRRTGSKDRPFLGTSAKLTSLWGCLPRNNPINFQRHSREEQPARHRLEILGLKMRLKSAGRTCSRTKKFFSRYLSTAETPAKFKYLWRRTSAKPMITERAVLRWNEEKERQRIRKGKGKERSKEIKSDVGSFSFYLDNQSCVGVH